MENKGNYFDLFKERWDIKSNLQLVIIFIVFAINGSLSVKISRPLLEYLSINQTEMSAWTFWPLRILIVFIAYQALLLVVGSLFGQFKFFLAFQKKTLGRFIPKKRSAK